MSCGVLQPTPSPELTVPFFPQFPVLWQPIGCLKSAVVGVLAPCKCDMSRLPHPLPESEFARILGWRSWSDNSLGRWAQGAGGERWKENVQWAGGTWEGSSAFLKGRPWELIKNAEPQPPHPEVLGWWFYSGVKLSACLSTPRDLDAH